MKQPMGASLARSGRCDARTVDRAGFIVTAVVPDHRPRRLADRIAARAVVLALDPHATVEGVARAAAALARGDAEVLDRAARRVRLTVSEEPRFLAARLALAGLESAVDSLRRGGVGDGDDVVLGAAPPAGFDPGTRGWPHRHGAR